MKPNLNIKTMTPAERKTFWDGVIAGVVCLALLLVDAITKQVAKAYFKGNGTTSPILPWIQDGAGNNILGYTLVYNKGMGYGLFSEYTWVLAVVSAVIGVGLIWFLIHVFAKKGNLFRYALVLMIAGDWGNFIDRAFFPDGVIDFIAVGNSSWPSLFTYVCNPADVFLSVGLVLLVIALIVDAVKETKAGKAKAEKARAASGSSHSAWDDDRLKALQAKLKTPSEKKPDANSGDSKKADPDSTKGSKEDSHGPIDQNR